MFISICFSLIFLLLVFNVTKNINKKKYRISSLINLTTYKLYNEVYITSAQYVNYDKKIMLIIYSKNKNVVFKECIVKYKSLSNACKPLFLYHARDNLFNLFEIKTLHNEVPLFIIINSITIKIEKSKRSNKNKIVTCCPILSNFDRPLMLIQTIEAYRYLGMFKIVVYYLSSSKTVMNILKYYSSIGIVDIYKFQLDSYLKDIEINSRKFPYIYHLIYFKLNHCFNEYKTQTNYMLYLDVDELLWPIKADNYLDIIKSLPKNDYYHLFPIFFKPNYELPQENDKNEKITLPDISIFEINKYCIVEKNFWQKYIILNTSSIMVADIHEPILYNNVRDEYVPKDIIFIRHTRFFNNVLKNYCTESKLMTKNITILENVIKINSDKVFNLINKNIM